MQIVALVTIPRGCLVNKKIFFMPFIGIIMAFSANNGLAVIQQLFGVSGMGTVAVNAAVPRTVG